MWIMISNLRLIKAEGKEINSFCIVLKETDETREAIKIVERLMVYGRLSQILLVKSMMRTDLQKTT